MKDRDMNRGLSNLRRNIDKQNILATSSNQEEDNFEQRHSPLSQIGQWKKCEANGSETLLFLYTSHEFQSNNPYDSPYFQHFDPYEQQMPNGFVQSQGSNEVKGLDPTWELALYNFDQMLLEGNNPELPLGVCKLDVYRDAIPEAIIEEPLYSYLNGEAVLPQLIYMGRQKQVLGSFGPMPPQEIGQLADFVLSLTEENTKMKTLVANAVQEEIQSAHEEKMEMIKTMFEQKHGVQVDEL